MAPASKPASLLDPALLKPAVWESLKKLHPRDVSRNPVMFVVWAGSLLTTVFVLKDLVSSHGGSAPLWFTVGVTLWLWFTVLFANFAEAVAEGRGKAQASALRRMRQDTQARRLRDDGREERVGAPALRKGDRVVCEAGDVIPGDGDVVEGIASVDESAVTGESARHPRVRRRPLRRHGRHQGAVRPHRHPHQRGPRRVVPRPDDWPGGGRGPQEDAQ